ncbi:hypothetical protein F8568_029720 [Actinomadura sp. LD22]|uniref:Uncharacterized protein n=1 Tax=Actinomadura physcomitrii TaxID=2650748 RepID=A0A6I4MK00_9ACTN|nr:hypothetical protein [Actinomadura physcomitrii]MWA04484.1 hypothetical protein [Actinomadura physcomitrii]
MRARPDHAEPRPLPPPKPSRGARGAVPPREALVSTRALLIVLVAIGAGALTAWAPQAAIPIGVGVGVVTLLAQIVKD